MVLMLVTTTIIHPRYLVVTYTGQGEKTKLDCGEETGNLSDLITDFKISFQPPDDVDKKGSVTK